MGCPCEVQIYAESSVQANKGFVLAKQEVDRLDLKYSHYREDSQLARLQVVAARPGGVVVDQETAALLNYANIQYLISDGMFDITTRSLSALWDRSEKIPDDLLLQSALDQTGWQRVRWNGSRLRIPTGFRFDFGGIVKEYAADRIAGILIKAGFNSGYVDLGGDLYILGPHAGGDPWDIGIRNPQRKKDAIAAIDLHSGGMASSGDYERYYEINGQRFSHIINPKTGWPLRSGILGFSAVSVVAPSCLVAGSVSTMAMLMPKVNGIRFLQQCGLPWFAV